MSVSNGSGFFGKMRNNLNERNPEEQYEEKTKIKVIVRIRPHLDFDRDLIYQQRTLNAHSGTMHVDKHQSVIQLDLDQKNKNGKQFHFDLICDGPTSQADLYANARITDMVRKVVDGYHSTIFAYG